MSESDSIADTPINDVSQPETGSDPQPNEANPGGNTGSSVLEKLLADAPEDNGRYLDHALNYDNSESTAKIIRGSEGFFGNLNKAVILIAMGVLEKFQEQLNSSSEEEENPDIEQELEPEDGVV